MRQGYMGVALILLFSFLVIFLFLSFPDLRFYKDFVKRLENAEISADFLDECVDADDFLSAAVLSHGVSDVGVGLSFDEFRILRSSKKESKKLQDLLKISGWKFSSKVLGNLFIPCSNGSISALIPNLEKQMDSRYISPDVIVVEGTISDLRKAWDILSVYLSSQIDASYLDIIW